MFAIDSLLVNLSYVDYTSLAGGNFLDENEELLNSDSAVGL